MGLGGQDQDLVGRSGNHQELWQAVDGDRQGPVVRGQGDTQRLTAVRSAAQEGVGLLIAACGCVGTGHLSGASWSPGCLRCPP